MPAGGNPPITLLGAGAGATIIDANTIDRVFHVHAGRTATISGVTIRNGLVPGTLIGGGIWNLGVLTLAETRLLVMRRLMAAASKTTTG